MKLAIQRLVRGDDGLTKVIYIDLGTLQQIADLTDYRIVNSGDLYEEPVASVDDPETPSAIQGEEKRQPGSRGENDGRNNRPSIPTSNQVTTPNAPNAPSGVTTPGSIRTPESRVPSAVSPPARANPEAPTQARPADLGPLGGIRTVQGSILPGLDPTRFDQSLKDWSAPTPDSIAGNPAVSQRERSLQSRRELENIKDDSLGIGNYTPTGTKMSPTLGVKDDAISSPKGITMSPTLGTKDDTVSTPNVASAPRGAVNAGIMAADGYPSSPAGTISAAQAAARQGTKMSPTLGTKDDISISGTKMSPTLGTKDDAVSAQASRIAGGITMSPTLGTKDDKVSTGTKMSPTLGTKDDFAGPVGTTKTGDSLFDSPSKMSPTNRTKDDSVAGGVISSAKAPATQAERTSGFVSGRPTVGRPTTTTMVDAAGYSQTERTGTAGWRNNNPGNLEASNWTKSQPGYIGAAGGVPAPGWTKAPDGTMSRMAVFDSYENGLKAQSNLIGTKYADYTISGMMAKYAPSFENNPVAYAKAISDAIGVDPNTTKISDLTPSQKSDMMRAMHEVEGNQIGTSKVSLTDKGIAARDNYTGPQTGADTPSERNAASRASMSAGFGEGGSRGVASGIGRNDSAGPGRGSSPGGPSIGGGIGRASSGGSSASSGGGNYGGGRAGSGKSASGGVSGASRSTAGKGGASPSAGSGGQSGAAQSGTSGKTGGYSSGNTSGTTSGHGLGIGRA